MTNLSHFVFLAFPAEPFIVVGIAVSANEYGLPYNILSFPLAHVEYVHFCKEQRYIKSELIRNGVDVGVYIYR